MTNLRTRLVCKGNRLDGTCRTNLRTAVTFRTAIATHITHRGLHQFQQIRTRHQHMIRTFRHTELTARTPLLHIGGRERARRCQGCVARRLHHILNHGQTAIHLLPFLCQRSRRGCQRSPHQEGPPTLINRITRATRIPRITRTIRFSRTTSPRPCIMQRVKIALLQTVPANHATAVVHLHRLEIDARSLAVARTLAALLAFALIKPDLQPGETGKETENGTHRTDGIAISSTTSPSQCHQHNQCHQGNDKGGQ